MEDPGGAGRYARLMPVTEGTAERGRRSDRSDGLVVVAALVALMWGVEVLDALLPANLDRYGIEPRDPDGLPGILAAPFLHDGFGHLISNTVPFVVMGVTIALAGLMRVVTVTAVVGAISGAGTWLTGGDNTVHVGASGVVFGYATYLLARGFYSRSILDLGIGVVVGVIWGTALVGGLLPEPGISWQAHLFGALGGVVAARMLTRSRAGGARRAAQPA